VSRSTKPETPTAREAEFVVSVEQECLTIVDGANDPLQLGRALFRFLQVLAKLAPSLSCGAGIFNAYGRVYVDIGEHLEFAALECESSYLLPLLVERQQVLAARALRQLWDEGLRLRLANNNHSGLLHGKTTTWGAHENYLVERRPAEFTEAVLPFLVTRLYAGSGGVRWPEAQFLAGVRPEFMELSSGGATTDCRAIHSTCREEHHMGPEPARFRYHQILGDGHRSHFNLALQLGATALALKAILFDRELAAHLAGVRAKLGSASALELLRRFNLLAEPGEAPRADPLAMEVQQVYLEGARRWAATLTAPPSWIARSLADWQDTLDALRRADRAWLSARLDAFAKYELFTIFLAERRLAWRDLSGQKEHFAALALLDHSYHEFASDESVFRWLEQAGALRHRVGPSIAPGHEPEPFVPETTTRARTRARFIRHNAATEGLSVDWSCVVDVANRRRCDLYDPFATEYGPWREYRLP